MGLALKLSLPINIVRGIPETHLAGAVHGRVGSKDLLGERGARARHANDEYWNFRARCTRHALAHPRALEAGDDLVDAPCQALALVLNAVALGELVRLTVMAESRVVLPDVVKILAERVAQSDFVPERHGLGEHRFRALQPFAILHGHFAVRGDARKGEGKMRVD